MDRAGLGVLTTLAAALCLLLAPALAAAGTIEGKVTDADTTDPLQNVYVCAYASFPSPLGSCNFTDGDGEYSLALQPSIYKVEFRAAESGLNYITQFWNDKSSKAEAQSIEVTAASVTAGVNAALEEGGQITGTVTDAASHKPIEGLDVCEYREGDEASYCDRTDATGEYRLIGLPTGAFGVEFFAELESGLNYVTQYYDGKSSRSEADPVGVTAGTTVAGVDAAMLEGHEVIGTVTDAVTGAPLTSTLVCALTPSKAFSRCAPTDATGRYTLLGLAPVGEHVVMFSPELDEGHDDEYETQYWDGKQTFAAADRIQSSGPGTTSGIDAQLTKIVPAPAEPAQVLSEMLPEPLLGKKVCPQGKRKKMVAGKARCVPPRKCRRGFRKRKVGGKTRCVRKQARKPREPALNAR